MAQNTMYVSKNNSPQTTLTNEITATEQTIPVADVSKLPAAPNIVSIGSGDDIELVYYASISGSTLTGCVRGYHGTTASIWYEDTPVYRAYTSYDHDTFKGNIEDLDTNKLDKTGDGSSTTVTFTEAGTLANPATGESQATLWGKILKLFNSASGHDHNGTNSKKVSYVNITDTPFFNNAGAHNSIYRGASLGTSVSAAQYTAIGAGTFENMYIGDYWTINSVVWRIAAFDYYYNTGDTNCTTHHAVIVPDTSLYDAAMNSTNTTEGGYYNSAMKQSNLATAISKINSAFGSDHVMIHRNLFVNAVTSGRPTNGSWYDSTIDLMNEVNVFGTHHFSPVGDGTNIPYNYAVDKSIFPLFIARPDLQCNRQRFWLRDVVSSELFAIAFNNGSCSYDAASSINNGVRPAFCLKS